MADSKIVRFSVLLTVEVNVSAWAHEYGWDSTAEAQADASHDLSEIGYYLDQPKWSGLAEVKGAMVIVNTD